jgi:hypothetical protein
LLLFMFVVCVFLLSATTPKQIVRNRTLKHRMWLIRLTPLQLSGICGARVLLVVVVCSFVVSFSRLYAYAANSMKKYRASNGAYAKVCKRGKNGKQGNKHQ